MSKVRVALSRRALAGVLGAAATLTAWSDGAHAQDAGTAASGQQDEAAQPAEDIIVTARKRAEAARDVPIAITALSGDTLTEKNIIRLADLGTVEPSFTLSLGANQPSTYLRGFGTYGSQFSQSVGKFVDNVSYGRDMQGRIPLFDLERLEVLKGPQVLLYGNSTTAGAINITTAKPGATFTYDLSASYEVQYDEAQVDGGVTVPISDAASLRIGGFYQRLGKGWLRNDLTGDHEPGVRSAGGRATLRLTPAGGWTVDLKVEVDRLRERGSTGQIIRQSSNPSRQVAEFRLDGHRRTDLRNAPFFAVEYQAIDNETYQLDVDVPIGGGSLHATTAYVDTRYGGNTGNASGLNDNLSALFQNYRQISQELRYAGSAGRIDYTFGAYVEDYNYDAYSTTAVNFPVYALPFPPFGRYVALDQDGRSYSIFGDSEFRLTDRLSVSAGARYSIINQSNDQTNLPSRIVPGIDFGTSRRQLLSYVDRSLDATLRTVFGSTAHVLQDVKVRERHFQPQVILKYRPDPLTMVYAKFVKGDKAGGADTSYSGTSPDGLRYGPERAVSYEIGVKGTSADRRLDYSVDVFSTTFDDLQTSAFLGTTVFVTNVGKAATRGLEASIGYRSASGLRLGLAGAYLDAKYKDFPNAVCTVAQTLATPAGTVCIQSLSGAPTPYQSKYSGSLDISYAFDVDDWTLTVGSAVVARSRYNTTTSSNDPLGDQRGFATLDLNAGFAPSSGDWKVALFARNITGVQTKEFSVPTPLIPGAFTTFISRGATFGARLSANY